jgi:two-component system, NtrC family, sensor kinase
MSDLDPEYISAAAAHLVEQTEASLSNAYELGRRALARGIGILDLFSLYDAVQKELVLHAPPAEQPRLAGAVSDFFRELVSPFEMSFRGYGEANGELKRLNEDLKLAYVELQAKQVQVIQTAKMASLGELVAGIAHEINNPLAFVMSHLHTAVAGIDKLELGQGSSAATKQNLKRVRDRLQESQLGAERIQNLVLKLRTFSRLDEGERKKVSIGECVASVLTILQHRYHSRIRVETHLGHPDVIECFPSLLNQAIMNLVSNSIDAIENDGAITITTGADEGSYVIVVADTGHGIPEEVQHRVLEPFFTTKPIGQGTGLGLSISFSIVQAHGGTLELVAREGGGTVATIRFPLEPALALPKFFRSTDRP